MRIFVKELARRPGRFVPVGGALTMLVVLLVVLGGFLDGLELSQTGPYRAQEGRLLVFSKDSELLIQRSQVDVAQAKALATAEGVAKVGALNQVASTAEDADGEIVDIVLFGYDLPTDVLPAAPPDGAVIDGALAERNDVKVGDTLLLGATSEPVEVAKIVGDLSQGSPTVWLSSKRWRQVVESTNPSALLPVGVDQALIVQPTEPNLDETQLEALAKRLGSGGIEVATADQAIQSLPVVQQQSSTFRGIIGVTFVVTLMVVALFFTLITLERVALYAVLKALGARTRNLLAGISVQAVCVSLVALLLGFVLSVAFVSVLPATLPVRVVPARLGQIAVGVLVSALLGSLFTLRRVLRIDPAEAIG
ncbi:ABC transporter permease [Candidatus Microthrix sp.]|jgi:putative ABC transport system permease protein|uniref:ABC transporter permease n=1 Tax=Candidatus Neomicrothrix sp. TaxID=2719034 RepID=UPI001B445FB0|nr:ABC transporter permease [Candidatus Microthrix sp.]MBP7877509.1 ABC transporter permease [Candidatus Microthrix sp.]